MLLPRTPSKVNDGLESRKKSLEALWGLHFKPRNSSWSPSKRDLGLLEDRVDGLMQYLFWCKGTSAGALDYAISQFEEQAPSILSRWIFKPGAESDVVLYRPPSESRLREDFLSKRNELGDEAKKDLLACLYNKLSLVAESIKSGQSYIVPHRPLDSVEASSASVNDQSWNMLLPKRNLPHNQLHTTSWIPSKDDHTAVQTCGQSSDEYLGDEDFIDHVDVLDVPPFVPGHMSSTTKAQRNQNSASPELYQTPPTSPVRRGININDDPDLMEGVDVQPPDAVFLKPEMRKRAYPEQQKDAVPRKASRGASRMNPPGGVSWASSSASFSTESTSSMTTSTTTASSLLTTPNTSFSTTFSADSRSTSFDRSLDDTEITIRRSIIDTRLQIPERDNSGNRISLYPNTTPNHSLTGLSINIRNQDKALEMHITERLEASPFEFIDLSTLKTPFKQLYEVFRVSHASKIPIDRFDQCLKGTIEDYDELWTSMRGIVKRHSMSMPERSSSAAWEDNSQRHLATSYSCILKYRDSDSGPLFEARLNPLRLQRSHRLSRQFSSDRFLIVGIPGPSPGHLPNYLRSRFEVVQRGIVSWLVETGHRFLGRTWRVFYTKAEDSKKKLKGGRSDPNEVKNRIYFFAEDGFEFIEKPMSGEADSRAPHAIMSVQEMIEWAIPSKQNQTQPCLKLFARLSLCVSPTTPTVQFRPSEIIRSDDAFADCPQPRRLNVFRSDEKKRQQNVLNPSSAVMNDGCARMSKKAADAIAQMLGLDETPSVYQGRIAGAKGLWMVDCLDEIPAKSEREYWIEITDSQLKFEGHAQDALYPEPGRVTFEVLDSSTRLTPSALSFRLIPILLNQGVNWRVFERLLTEDLNSRIREVEIAMDDPLSLRSWNQKNGFATKERVKNGGIEMMGALPRSDPERINWLLEHGFDPRQCLFLRDQILGSLKEHCLRLENKPNIRIGRSTSAMIIADPLAVLEEGEVHVGFSTSFRDQRSGFNDTMLHDVDVLVARNPAHLPSDIQKVRAVFKPELRRYRDVVVFSSKGRVPLANKLSGGDYDGDTVWLCWEPDIVEPFVNAMVPDPLGPSAFGIEKDSVKVSDLLAQPNYIDNFLRHAFNFNLRPNMLGICSNYHEALCYSTNSVASVEAVEIGHLLGLLVDSAKNGYIFDEARWTSYLVANDLRKSLPIPAYRDKGNAKPTRHIIDRLVFEVAKGIRHKALGDLSTHYNEAGYWDVDLVQIRNDAIEDAKSNASLDEVLKRLTVSLEAIRQYWALNNRPEKSDQNLHPLKENNGPSFRAVVETCRQDFLALSPTPADTALDDIPKPIRDWQQEHKAGKPSHWDHLKASVAFYRYYKSNFVWFTAGLELCEIKAMAGGKGTYRVATSEMYESFKLDDKLVDRKRKGEAEQEASGSVIDEEDTDEFDDWDWENEA